MPRGDQPRELHHIDTVVISGPEMVPYDPHGVSIGTDTEVGTPGYGSCPVVPGHECPNCKCLEHQNSDHRLVVWEFEAKLRPARAKGPGQLRWKMGGLLENKGGQAAYARCATDRGGLAKIAAKRRQAPSGIVRKPGLLIGSSEHMLKVALPFKPDEQPPPRPCTAKEGQVRVTQTRTAGKGPMSPGATSPDEGTQGRAAAQGLAPTSHMKYERGE